MYYQHQHAVYICHVSITGAQSIIKQVAEMRTSAQAEMVLDENSEAEVVISYLSDLLQQAQTQQTEQERIVYHQSFLNLPKMVNDDLALAQEEVSCPCCRFIHTPWLRGPDGQSPNLHSLHNPHQLVDCLASASYTIAV